MSLVGSKKGIFLWWRRRRLNGESKKKMAEAWWWRFLPSWTDWKKERECVYVAKSEFFDCNGDWCWCVERMGEGLKPEKFNWMWRQLGMAVLCWPHNITLSLFISLRCIWDHPENFNSLSLRINWETECERGREYGSIEKEQRKEK